MCGALDLIFNCDESRTDNGGSARLKADTVRDLCAASKCASQKLELASKNLCTVLMH